LGGFLGILYRCLFFL